MSAGLDTPTPQRIRSYLFDGLAPFCRDRGWDETHGCFHERLDTDGNPVDMGYTRLVVQCRQIYVLAHATILSGRKEFTERAQEAIESLVRLFWDARHGGWYFSVEPTGAPSDPTKDCYGHAFVLFAMAYAHRAFGGSEPLELVERTLDVLETRFPERRFGGYLEATSDDWEALPRVRRQNPHMHLLEAFLALHRATGEARFAELAQRMLELFERHFFDAETGTLAEYFEPDWSPHRQSGHIREPGHHFEWTWLLLWYAESFDRPEVVARADRLFEWGVRHGVDEERGGVFDELDASGQRLRDTKRMWPLTEAIKSSGLRYERDGKAEERERLERWLRYLFEERLLPDGRWREHLDREGRPTVEYMPNSTPYHMFLGLSEALRALEGAARS